MSEPTTNSPRPAPAAETAPQTKATWVRGKRAPRRKRADSASALQLGAIHLASNRHA